MNGYGIAIVALFAMLALGAVVMVIAGSFAVMRHPDRNDANRNAERYVRPAFAGGFMVIAAMLGFVGTAVVAIADALSP